MKVITLIFILTCSISNVFTQEVKLTLDETVTYINEKLKIAKWGGNNRDYFEISISTNGLMTISKLDSYNVRSRTTFKTIYLKSLSHTELISDKNWCLLNFYEPCSGCSPNPFNSVGQLELTVLGCPSNIGEAFDHLIELAKTNSSFQEKPAVKKDPFAK